MKVLCYLGVAFCVFSLLLLGGCSLYLEIFGPPPPRSNGPEFDPIDGMFQFSEYPKPAPSNTRYVITEFAKHQLSESLVIQQNDRGTWDASIASCYCFSNAETAEAAKAETIRKALSTIIYRADQSDQFPETRRDNDPVLEFWVERCY